nr:hypothetical protein [Tanacetum cinerariifolium]
MHNNIMAASLRDRPSMLATGRYPQWRSWFLRYIDTTPNGKALRKCILSGPYKPRTVLVQAVAAIDDSPAIPEHITQYQKEVNELRTERLARNANPLALVATAQANQDPYHQTSKSHKLYAPSSKPSIPTKTHTTTRYKGKEIAKPITPPSETAFEEDSDPEQAQMDKDIQKNLALIAKYFKKIYKPTNNNLRTSSNSRNKNEFGHFANEFKKPIKVKDSTYHKENMLLCKQVKQGVPLEAKQYDWLADMDEEIDEQELEAHYSYIAKIQEVPTADSGTDSEPLEQSHKLYAPSSKPSIPTKTHTTTRYKGKEIAKPITPPSETASEEDSDPEQAQMDKDIQKNLALIAKYFKKIYKPTNNNLRTSSNSRNKNVDTTLWENVDMDEEIDEQELEAHYSYIAKIQEVPTANSGTDSEPLEQDFYAI